MDHLCAAIAALKTHNPAAALDALDLAGQADSSAGATARWAARPIMRGPTDSEIVRVIAALEHEHTGA